MKITIWIATKITSLERKKFLYQAIESVLMQSNKNWELIISDDNSEIKLDYSKYKNNTNIKIFYQKKSLWIFKNFNFCLNNSTWDFFVPLWDDDLLNNNFIEIIINYIEKNNKLDLILSNFSFINKNWDILHKSYLKPKVEKKWNNTLNKYITNFFLHKELPIFLCWVIRTKKIIKLWWYPDLWMATDFYLIYFYLENCDFWICKNNLFKIRKHNLNLSWIRKIDIMRKNTIKVMKKVKINFYKKLNKKNQIMFLQNEKNLYTDHINLLIKFKDFWRIRGIKEFFWKKINIRSTIILFFWILFWKKIHAPIIYINDIYNNIKFLLLK